MIPATFSGIGKGLGEIAFSIADGKNNKFLKAALIYFWPLQGRKKFIQFIQRHSSLIFIFLALFWFLFSRG